MNIALAVMRVILSSLIIAVFALMINFLACYFHMELYIFLFILMTLLSVVIT